MWQYGAELARLSLVGENGGQRLSRVAQCEAVAFDGEPVGILEGIVVYLLARAVEHGLSHSHVVVACLKTRQVVLDKGDGFVQQIIVFGRVGHALEWCA